MKSLHWRPSTGQLVFILFLFAGSYFYYPVDYDNTSSRLFLVSSIVDFGSLNIDAYADLTADKSRHGTHYYSNKAIGAPLLAASVYWLHRRFQPGPEHPPLTRAMRYVIRLFTATLPFAFLGACLFSVARSWSGNEKRSLIITLVYGLGSIALIHAGMLSGHGTAAAFGFFSFAAWLRIKERSHPGKEGLPENFALPLPLLSLVSGFSAGFAALCDYTAVLVAVMIGFYVLSTPVPKRLKVIFCCAGLSCAAVLAGYNWMCFGSPLSFSYAHQVIPVFSEGSAKGLLGISWPKSIPLLALLFSPSRGLLAVMPVFAFSLVGLWNMLRTRSRRHEGALVLFVLAGYLFMIAGFYGWHGGWTYGPRYLVPVLPFLAAAMIYAPRENLFFGMAAVASILQVNLVAMTMPNIPEIVVNPIRELIVPFIREGEFAQTWPGWMGLPAGRSILLYVFACFLIFLVAWRGSFHHKDTKTQRTRRKSFFNCREVSAIEKDSALRADFDAPLAEGRGHLTCGPASQKESNLCDFVPLAKRVVKKFRTNPIGVFTVLWIVAVGVMVYGFQTRPAELVSESRERLLFHLRNREAIQSLVSIAAENYRRVTSEGEKDNSSGPPPPARP